MAFNCFRIITIVLAQYMALCNLGSAHSQIYLFAALSVQVLVDFVLFSKHIIFSFFSGLSERLFLAPEELLPLSHFFSLIFLLLTSNKLLFIFHLSAKMLPHGCH